MPAQAGNDLSGVVGLHKINDSAGGFGFVARQVGVAVEVVAEGDGGR